MNTEGISLLRAAYVDEAHIQEAMDVIRDVRSAEISRDRIDHLSPPSQLSHPSHLSHLPHLPQSAALSPLNPLTSLTSLTSHTISPTTLIWQAATRPLTEALISAEV